MRNRHVQVVELRSRLGRGTIGQKRGAELELGDIIEVWWRPGHDCIVGLEPYKGPHAELFPGGAQVASFGIAGQMMIDNEEWYSVVLPVAERCEDGL